MRLHNPLFPQEVLTCRAPKILPEPRGKYLSSTAFRSNRLAPQVLYKKAPFLFRGPLFFLKKISLHNTPLHNITIFRPSVADINRINHLISRKTMLLWGRLPISISSSINTLLFVNICYKQQLKLFFRYLQFIMLRMPVPKHRLVFLWLKYFLRDIWARQKTLIKGFSVILKGKLGVTGNKRKRKLSYVFGFGNSTNFKDKVTTQEGLIRTVTGVVNVKVHYVL